MSEKTPRPTEELTNPFAPGHEQRPPREPEEKTLLNPALPRTEPTTRPDTESTMITHGGATLLEGEVLPDGPFLPVAAPEPTHDQPESTQRLGTQRDMQPSPGSEKITHEPVASQPAEQQLVDVVAQVMAQKYNEAGGVPELDVPVTDPLHPEFKPRPQRPLIVRSRPQPEPRSWRNLFGLLKRKK